MWQQSPTILSQLPAQCSSEGLFCPRAPPGTGRSFGGGHITARFHPLSTWFPPSIPLRCPRAPRRHPVCRLAQGSQPGTEPCSGGNGQARGSKYGLGKGRGNQFQGASPCPHPSPWCTVSSVPSEGQELSSAATDEATPCVCLPHAHDCTTPAAMILHRPPPRAGALRHVPCLHSAGLKGAGGPVLPRGD